MNNEEDHKYGQREGLPSTHNAEDGLSSTGNGKIGSAAGLRGIDGDPLADPRSGRKGSHSCCVQ